MEMEKTGTLVLFSCPFISGSISISAMNCLGITIKGSGLAWGCLRSLLIIELLCTLENNIPKTLLIRPAKSGFGYGIYVNGKPSFFYKNGDELTNLREWIVEQKFDKFEDGESLDADELEQSFA